MSVDQGELEQLASALRLAGSALEAAQWHTAAAAARFRVYSGHFGGPAGTSTRCGLNRKHNQRIDRSRQARRVPLSMTFATGVIVGICFASLAWALLLQRAYRRGADDAVARLAKQRRVGGPPHPQTDVREPWR